jgi:hypothetical protein
MPPHDKTLPPAALKALADLDRAEWVSFHFRWALGYILGLISGIFLGPFGLYILVAFLPEDSPGEEFGPLVMGYVLVMGSFYGACLAMSSVAFLHATATIVRAIRCRRWAQPRRFPVFE